MNGIFSVISKSLSVRPFDKLRASFETVEGLRETFFQQLVRLPISF
jgi:hypothetical protein